MMLKADLHVHTILSKHHLLSKFHLIDGLNTPEEMVKAAERKGLDCIAITEHNVLFEGKKAEELSQRYDVTVIPGIELYLNGKDVIALDIEKVPSAKNLEEFKEKVNEQNGFLIAPHPYDPLGRGYKNLKPFDAVEVVNAFGPYGFEKLVRKSNELGKTKVCGSDAHCPDQLGWTHCLIDSEVDRNSILEALRKGKSKPVYGKIPKSVQIKYYVRKYLFGESIFKSIPEKGEIN